MGKELAKTYDPKGIEDRIYQKWMETDGTVQFMTEQPGFEEYAEYMTGLYDDGLVYYQATSNDTGVIAAFQSEMAGVVEAAHWEAYTLETVSAPEGEDLSQYTDDNIGYISALVPDDNKGDASAVRVWSGQGYNNICVLPSYNTAEQSAAVVDWMDKKLEPELYPCNFRASHDRGHSRRWIGARQGQSKSGCGHRGACNSQKPIAVAEVL